MKALIALIFCLFISSMIFAQELVTDGGFETDLAIGFHWVLVWGQSSTGIFWQDSTQKHSGNYSCAIKTDNTSFADYTGIKQEDIEPQIGTEYLMTFWFKGVIPNRTDGEVEAQSSTGSNDAMGIDSKNNTPPITADNGEFVISPNTYNNWTKVNYYWLAQSGYGGFLIDMGSFDNTESTYYIDDVSIVPSSTVGVIDDYKGIITKFELFQNYPNPFNPTTTIAFTVPERADVKVEIYNQLGQIVHTELNYNMPVGLHKVEFDATDLSSGIYFARIESGSHSDMIKMVLMK